MVFIDTECFQNQPNPYRIGNVLWNIVLYV